MLLPERIVHDKLTKIILKRFFGKINTMCILCGFIRFGEINIFTNKVNFQRRRIIGLWATGISYWGTSNIFVKMYVWND